MYPYPPVLESEEAGSPAYVQSHAYSLHNRSAANEKPLIDLSSEVDESTHVGNLLREAVLKRDLIRIKTLISDGKIGVNTRDSLGRTALMTAAKKGCTAVLNELIVFHQADINCIDPFGYSALMYAMESTDMANWPHIVQSLLDQDGICINQKGYNNGDRALSILEKHGELDHGFRRHIRNQLLLAAERNGDTESAAEINELKADVNAFCYGDFTELMHACKNGDLYLDTVLTLLKNPKVKILLKNKRQQTALSIIDDLLRLYPSNKNYLTIKKILIAHLYNINSSETLPQFVIKNDACDNFDIVSFSDDPLLIQVIAKKETDVAIVFIKSGVNVNAPSKLGQTALMVAAQRGNAEVLTALIQAEADVNARDIFDRTALMYACASGDLNTALALLDDPTAKDKSNLLLVDKFKNTPFNIINNILQRNPGSIDHKIIKDMLITLFHQN